MKRHVIILVVLVLFICGFFIRSVWAENKVVRMHIVKIPAQEEKVCANQNNQIYKQYYENGGLYLEIQCHDGQPDGFFRQYYDDGQLWIKGEYINGKIEGLLRHYFDDGQLWKEYVYKAGKPEGIPKVYSRDGLLRKDENITGQGLGANDRFNRDEDLGSTFAGGIKPPVAKDESSPARIQNNPERPFAPQEVFTADSKAQNDSEDERW